MGFQVNIRLKNNKFLFQTFSFSADPVLFLEMLFQKRIVFEINVLMETQSFANKTRFVGLSTVQKELVFGVEMNATKTTSRMSFERTFIFRRHPRVQMQLELLRSVEHQLSREYFFVFRANLADSLGVFFGAVVMELGPSVRT
jgi:hypothetical protein